MKKFKLTDVQAIKLIEKICDKYPENVKRAVCTNTSWYVCYYCPHKENTPSKRMLYISVTSDKYEISISERLYNDVLGNAIVIPINQKQFNYIQKLFEDTLYSSITKHLIKDLNLSLDEVENMFTDEEEK